MVVLMLVLTTISYTRARSMPSYRRDRVPAETVVQPTQIHPSTNTNTSAITGTGTSSSSSVGLGSACFRVCTVVTQVGKVHIGAGGVHTRVACHGGFAAVAVPSRARVRGV